MVEGSQKASGLHATVGQLEASHDWRKPKPMTRAVPAPRSLRERFIGKVWATHNNSSEIRSALAFCVAQLPTGEKGLNVGSGETYLHPSIINLDLVPSDTTDVCGNAHAMPFRDEGFGFVMSQEVLEHLKDPFLAMLEMRRVLKRGGFLYLQVPFVIGYHPGPTDFWRFTKEGVREILTRSGLECVEIRIAVGGGTGFYRILVEFAASLASRVSARFYFPVKAGAAILCFPLKWLDSFLISGASM